MTTRTASCTCGRLKVTCEGEPFRRSMCHCIACQKRTGSIYGVNVRYTADQITKVEGKATEFVRVGDSGLPITYRFCPTCGTTVYWTLDSVPGVVALGVGTFGDPTLPAPKVAVYEATRHPWAAIDPSVEMEHHD